MPEPDGRLREAALEYLRRRERQSHPAGNFDGRGRWYPAEYEQRECCGRVRIPSATYPYSYLNHCRTAAHVAALYGVDGTKLRNAARYLAKDVVR